MAQIILLLQQHRKLGITAGIIAIFAAIFPSYIPIVLIILTFLLGITVCLVTLSPETLLPNLLRNKERERKGNVTEDELNMIKRDCPVCGKDSCNRHRPELNLVALQPWTKIKLPQRVDSALEEIMDLVLKEYVYTWYRDLSQDESFVDEIRYSIRFLVAALVRRLSKVDVTTVITHNIIKTAMRHLHFYLQVRKKLKSGEDIEQRLLDYYSKHLHVAATNRRAELDYLRNTVENLFTLVLPINSMKCKSLGVLLREILAGAVILPALDVLADPDVINNIILIFLDPTQPPEATEPPSAMVPILENFSKPKNSYTSCLHLEITDILSNPEALFPFMQFMKAEASVNVLQFYLSVEEFNNKILTPELSESQLDELHKELKNIYTMYCDEKAFDRIHFDEDILTQLKEICDGPPDGVIKLQTTTPLFRAYDHAHHLLANTFLPLFHQSDDYYQMLCGERLPSKLQRSLSSSSLNQQSKVSTPPARGGSRRGESLSLTKLGNKIKGVFKPSAYEDISDGSQFTEVGENGVPSGMENSLDPDFYPSYENRLWLDGPRRDLSTWRVSISDIVPKPDPDNPKGKSLYLFLVEVRRVDVMENDFEKSHWQVFRRYNEFYVLEQKLTEFHGEFEDAHLPPKKNFGTRDLKFLEEKRNSFEQYLKHLLTKPTLRGSELLFTFLTSEYELTSSFLPDINLSKIVKTGALKLVREKGQHLDPFLLSFLQSTETLKPRPCRWSDRDSDTISISSEKMANPLFENNANVELALTPSFPPEDNIDSVDRVPITGGFDTLLYLVEYVYIAPRWVCQVLMVLRIWLRSSVDVLFDWFIDFKLRTVAQEHRAVRILHLIRDILFFDTDAPRTEEDKRERKERALHELKCYIPRVFTYAIGAKRHKEGTELVHGALQHPKLNKQLSYMLLDECLRELFPELLSDKNPLDDVLASPVLNK